MHIHSWGKVIKTKDGWYQNCRTRVCGRRLVSRSHIIDVERKK